MSKEKNLSKLALINVLKKSSPEARSRLINYLNSEGINVLSESVHNVLFNDAPLKSSQRRRLKKQYSKDKKILKEISKRRGIFKKKKRLLKQSGGFLGTLLGIVIWTYFKRKKIDNKICFFIFVKVLQHQFWLLFYLDIHNEKDGWKKIFIP